MWWNHWQNLIVKPRFHHDHDSESHCYTYKTPQGKAILIIKVKPSIIVYFTPPKFFLTEQSSVAATPASK